MNVFLLLLAALAFSWSARAQSFDVEHYDLRLNLQNTNATNDTIRGMAGVRVKALSTLTSIRLELLLLSVDSVKVDGTPVLYSYNDTLLDIDLGQTLSPNDTQTVWVWYRGTPFQDPSGLGGWYNNNGYVFNVGVGFTAWPPNLGKVWFPCVDNFTDKATYTYRVRIDSARTAACSGYLVSDVGVGPNLHELTWRMDDPICTYHASVAAANYAVYRDTFPSIGGTPIPVSIYVKPATLAALPFGFTNLDEAFAAFENRFGPYPWPRVGYAGVDFFGAALEHPANIAYPEVIMGLTLYETLMAHELAHSWFGNLVTCDSPQEMWLNEGFAAYCESLFLGDVKGKASLKTYLRDQFNDVLRSAHEDDGGYYALNNIPNEKVYGSTVYYKGASVVHTLRHYLGDSLFFGGCQQQMTADAFGNFNTNSFRAQLESFSGQNLQDFFDAWVLSPGFPHFSLDSLVPAPGGPSNAWQVHLRQRSHQKPVLANSNRIPVRLMGANFEQQDVVVDFDGASGSETFVLPFVPVAAVVDPDEQVMDARLSQFAVSTSNGITSFPAGFMTLDINAIADSAALQLTHHWVAPDPISPPLTGLNLVGNRYWQLSGVTRPGFSADLSLSFDASNGNPDTAALAGVLEDSILVVHRKGPGQAWQVWPNQVLDKQGSATNGVGSIKVLNAALGEYALAVRNGFVGRTPSLHSLAMRIWPNPTDGSLSLNLNEVPARASLTVTDLSGRVLWQQELAQGQRLHRLQLGHLGAGTYVFTVQSPDGQQATQQVVLH